MNNLTYHHKIGILEIFTEMAECGRQIYDIFTRHGGPPLLIAQMQQGKTGTAIEVIDHFIKCCEADGLKDKDYEVIYLTNIADNVLNDQNDQRLTDAGLVRKVRILHHADLRNGNFPANLSASRRLLIIDECHLAIGDNKPLHKFFKKLGINYGQSIKTWGNKENYVLSMSATPYAANIVSRLKDDAFERVVMPVNPDYYSLKDMDDAGRLIQSDQVTKNGLVTPFFELRMIDFISLCDKHGAGFMVARSTGEGPELLTEYIHTKYPEVDVKVFEANPTNNISSLDNRLSKAPYKPFVAIIRGSLRAGKTLITTKNIRMWLEPPKSLGDTMCQVVGRCVGFEMENGVNRRKQDTFPLYCNTSELKMAIKFFADQEVSPSGAWSKSTSHVVQDRKVEVLDGNTDEEITQKYPIKWINHNSRNKDPIESIIHNKGLWGWDSEEDKYRAYHMDGPHPNRLKEWEEFQRTHPDWVGRYVTIIPIGQRIETTYDGKVSEKSLYNA